MNKYDVGVITDGVLGCNLAYNLSGNGYTTVLYNTGLDRMPRDEINQYISNIQEMGILASTSVEMTANLLKTPRIIFIVSRNSIYADDIIKELHDIVREKDIIVDTCDANYKITAKRCRLFEERQIEYIGAGFSGGEAEALDGASIMMAGSLDAYNELYEMLSCISSKYDGFPCCAYMGPDGAGQYVKMIHNGIEYGIMQLLAEAVDILTHFAGCDRTELCEIMNEWASGDNEGYFIQITYDILSKKDAKTDKPIIDITKDKVGYSKSVVWLCNSAAELSVPIPSIYAALNQRFLSVMKESRTAFAKMTGGLKIDNKLINDERKSFIEAIRNSLYLSSICVYVQAFSLLNRASDLYIWGTDMLDAAVTFQGGSFIRSRLLSRVIDAYRNNSAITNLLEDPYFASIVKQYSTSLRKVVCEAARTGIPVPVMSASLAYADSYASENLQTGIVELYRDYIQNTGFEKNDGSNTRFHANWRDIRDEIECDELL